MKKLSRISVVLIAAFALVAAFTWSTAYTCGGDKASTATKVNAESKSYACGSKAEKAEKASATMIGNKSDCSSYKGTKTAMAVKDGKDGKTCTVDGVTYEARNLNIAGMTCGGCEKAVSAALASSPGVHKVEKVCFESGTAMVWVKADKNCEMSMVKAVADKGFKAEIIPAVATNTSAGDKACPVTGKTGTCAKMASADKKADCSQPCGSKSKATSASAEAL
jgi:copper chaperone